MKKDYQTKVASAATEQVVMPDIVSLAMADPVERVCSPSPPERGSAPWR